MLWPLPEQYLTVKLMEYATTQLVYAYKPVGDHVTYSNTTLTSIVGNLCEEYSVTDHKS